MDKKTRDALELLAAIPYIGGRKPPVCPVCKVTIGTVEQFKQSNFGRKKDIVHKGCWDNYCAAMAAKLDKAENELRKLRRDIKRLRTAG